MIGENITQRVYTRLQYVGIDVVDFTTETTKIKNAVITYTRTNNNQNWDSEWLADDVATAILKEIVFKAKTNIPVYFELKTVTAEGNKATIEFAFGNLK